ncbi:MAG: DUF1461 domain-containing protein [Eggerthellaceae bacterium]|nr:DUF1461 domain-containing protein [Eggerthellaceae bacterium]
MATSRAADRALAAVAAAGLAVALVAAGFAACAAPATTRLVSEATSDFDAACYAPAALTDLACATRAYTVEPHADPDAAREALCADILAAAREASAEGSPVAGRWDAAARGLLAAADAPSAPDDGASGAGALTPTRAVEALGALDDRYALDADALSHLADCNRLIAGALPLAGVASAAGVVALAALVIRGRRRAAGAALVAAPVLVLAALAALGAWGALDFDELFAAFHAVLFPQGNWTFSWDSLLICMYPIAFWMGMAGTWLIATAVLSILCLIAGVRLRRARPARREPGDDTAPAAHGA